jgi:hypothetical protein
MPTDPLALVSQRDLAMRWQKSVRTLQRWRNDRYGPASLQIGGTIMYRVADVLAFEQRQRHGGEAE